MGAKFSGGKIRSRVFGGVREMDSWLSAYRDYMCAKTALGAIRPVLLSAVSGAMPLLGDGVMRKMFKGDGRNSPDVCLSVVRGGGYRISPKLDDAVLEFLDAANAREKCLVRAPGGMSVVVKAAPFIGERARLDAEAVVDSEFPFLNDTGDEYGISPEATEELARGYRKYSKRAKLFRAELKKALGDISARFMPDGEYSLRYESAEGVCTAYTSKRSPETVLDVGAFREIFGDFGAVRYGTFVYSVGVYAETPDETRRRERLSGARERFFPLSDGYYSFETEAVPFQPDEDDGMSSFSGSGEENGFGGVF